MINNFFQENKKSKFLKVSGYVAIIFILLMTIQIVNYLIVNPNVYVDPVWIAEITAKCGAEKLD